MYDIYVFSPENGQFVDGAKNVSVRPTSDVSDVVFCWCREANINPMNCEGEKPKRAWRFRIKYSSMRCCLLKLSAQVIQRPYRIWMWWFTSCSNVRSSLLWHNSTHRHMGTAKLLLSVILQQQQFKTLHIFLNTITASVEFWTCWVKICNTLRTPADWGHTFQTVTAPIHFIFADTVVYQWRLPQDGSRLVLAVTLHQYEYKNRLATGYRLFNHGRWICRRASIRGWFVTLSDPVCWVYGRWL